jgi:ATP-dependent helicase/nuclease subunit A
VLSRPDGDPATPLTVCPGEHRFGSPEDGYSVVWWSPEPDVLALGAETPFGLRRDDLIVKEVPAAVLTSYRKAYESWRASRDAAIDAGSIPSLLVKTATDWASEEPHFSHVDVIAVDGSESGPSGARYGTLVHGSLAAVPLDASPAIISKVVDTQARIVGATKAEVDAAVSSIRRVLAHDLLSAARLAERNHLCFREMPVTLLVNEILVEGVVDFAFDDGEGFTVIDFKTDRAEGELLEAYRRQVSFYARAIATATGRPGRGILMKI